MLVSISKELKHVNHVVLMFVLVASCGLCLQGSASRILRLLLDWYLNHLCCVTLKSKRSIFTWLFLFTFFSSKQRIYYLCNSLFHSFGLSRVKSVLRYHGKPEPEPGVIKYIVQNITWAVSVIGLKCWLYTVQILYSVQLFK